MKKILLLTTLVVVSNLSLAQEKVYMSTKSQGKVEFEISEEYFWFEAESGSMTDLTSNAGDDEFTFLWSNKGFLKVAGRRGHKFDSTKRAMKRKYGQKMKKLSPVFLHNGSHRQVIQNQIFLKMNGEEPTRKLIKNFKALFIPVEHIEDLYLVEVTKADPFDILEIVETLNENEQVEFAEPNFLRMIDLATNDSFYSNQWSLENDGSTGTADADVDVEGAWLYSTGQGVKVAVLDNGVDLNHEDLSSNLLPGYDATDRNLAGFSQGNDFHGTAVSGVIAAVANNNKGIAGVAYNSNIIPIRVTYTHHGTQVANDSWVVQGISDAITAGADVVNMSFSYNGSGSSSINTALDQAANSGRGGLGMILVASSGNGNTSTVLGPANRSNVLAVGASSFCDLRWSPSGCTPYSTGPGGSNYGNDLDVVAPGRDIWTLDNMGILGRSSGNYTGNFDGTSAAAPMVSAIAALILSVDPGLTNDEVMSLIRRNTDKVGGYSYATTTGKNDGTWNNEMGYGRVNAKAAIEEVRFDLVDIAGSDYACVSRVSANYTLTNMPAGITAQSWSASSNLNITSTSSTGVSLKASQNGSSAWVNATLSNGVVIERDLWAGKPATPSSISGPPLVQSGAFANYIGSATNGSASYKWILPYPHQVVSSINIFGADWQMLNTTTTQLNAFTGTNGSDGYVQFSGVNGCGVGPARLLYVSHDPNGGGAIPIAQDKEVDINVYPNPSNDLVNIELGSNTQGAKLLSLELIDNRLVTRFERVFDGGVTSFGLNVRNFNKGIYELRMKTSEGIVNRRVIIE